MSDIHDETENSGQPTSSARPPAFRIADHMALDFLNTVAAPQGTTIEWIGSGADLLQWLVGAAALEPSTAGMLAQTWAAKKLDAVAKEAVELREWFRAVVARCKSQGMSAIDVMETAHLNGILARDAAYPEIAPAAESGWRMTAARHWTEPGQLLVPVAAAMADLMCNADWDLVRRCENPPCTIWFYDRTKGHRRRWCSQAMCGNRAKVAAFRERQRAEK